MSVVLDRYEKMNGWGRKRKLPIGFVVISFIYFFVNSFLLPEGLLYTTLLTPFFLIWLKQERAPIEKIILVFLLIFVFLFCVHSYNGIQVADYLKSTTLYLSCVIFVSVVFVFVKKYGSIYEPLQEKILKYNIVFVFIAVGSLVVWKTKNIFWYSNELNENLGLLPRLKLLTYESSYYSILLVPAFFLYFQYFYFSNLSKKRLYLFASVIFSLILSLSYGTLGAIFLSLFLFVIINFLSRKRSKYNLKFIVILSIVGVLALYLVFGPLSESGFAKRIFSIFGGTDTSVNGRSFESYLLADKVLDLRSHFWGVGPGQFKILGKNIVDDFYDYTLLDTSTSNVARLPCATAETFAVFGYLGVIIRLAFEWFLFVKTKVAKSSFRLCLFLFMFFTQFVGSNITNIPEYTIWILAFSNIFPDGYFRKKVLLRDPVTEIKLP